MSIRETVSDDTSSLEEIEEGDELSPTEELYRVSQATNSDGTVDVQIHDWEKSGDTAVVEFITPSGDLEEETMNWPSRDDPKYKFVRLCRQYGSGIIDPDALIGVYVPADDGEWELNIEYRPSFREIVSTTNFPPFWESVGYVSCALFFLSLLVLIPSIFGGLLLGWSVVPALATFVFMIVTFFLTGLFMPEDE